MVVKVAGTNMADCGSNPSPGGLRNSLMGVYAVNPPLQVHTPSDKNFKNKQKRKPLNDSMTNFLIPCSLLL